MKNEEILERHGIRATPTRMLVYRAIEEADHPLSQMEIEQRLETVDRSTVSRSVSLFLTKGLVHTINDRTGTVKYEICRSNHDTSEKDDDTHVHFHCRVCGRTFCLQQLPTPEVTMPEGFSAEQCDYLVTGVCPACAYKA